MKNNVLSLTILCALCLGNVKPVYSNDGGAELLTMTTYAAFSVWLTDETSKDKNRKEQASMLLGDIKIYRQGGGISEILEHTINKMDEELPSQADLSTDEKITAIERLAQGI